jgi:hypothetical protein
MASELELRWLKVNELKGAAKHFALFCKDDIEKQADQKEFDLTVYQDAIKLVLSKLDRSLTLENLSRRIAEDSGIDVDSNNNNDESDNVSVDTDNSEILQELESAKNDADDVNTDIHTQGERISGEASDAD